jgi:hypothetical protein
MIRERPNEYQADSAKVRKEDADKIVKDNLSVGDLKSAFDLSILPFTAPGAGATRVQQDAMFKAYASVFKDHYLRGASISDAKNLAMRELKVNWGQTLVNNKRTVMLYPPENSATMQGVEGGGEHLAKDAIAAIKERYGDDVKRESLIMQPIPGVTGQAYRTQQRVPYHLMWADKDGYPRELKPGDHYYADGEPYRAEQRQKESAESERIRAANLPLLEVEAKRERDSRAAFTAARRGVEPLNPPNRARLPTKGSGW